MCFSFQGINHPEKLILYYRNTFVHIGQTICESRLEVIYSDSHIQKRKVEIDGCHQFTGNQDQKKWVLKKQFVY